MDKKDLTNLGDEIKDIVQNAVNTRDFHQLNRDISGTVNTALNEVKRSIGINSRSNGNGPINSEPPRNPAYDMYNQRLRQDQRQRQDSKQRQDQRQQQYRRQWQDQRQQQYQGQQQRQYMPAQKTSNTCVPVGRVSGTLLSVFGGIGIGLFGVAVLVLSILSSAFFATSNILEYIVVWTSSVFDW